MDENGRQLIRDLIKGGLKRAEIKEELIKAGYDPNDIERGLDFAYMVSEVGSLKPENSANPKIAVSKAPPQIPFANAAPQAPSINAMPKVPLADAHTQTAPHNPEPKSKNYMFVIAIVIIVAVSAIFYALYSGTPGAQDAQKRGMDQNMAANPDAVASGNGNDALKSETGLLDGVGDAENTAVQQRSASGNVSNSSQKAIKICDFPDKIGDYSTITVEGKKSVKYDGENAVVATYFSTLGGVELLIFIEDPRELTAMYDRYTSNLTKCNLGNTEAFCNYIINDTVTDYRTKLYVIWVDGNNFKILTFFSNMEKTEEESKREILPVISHFEKCTLK